MPRKGGQFTPQERVFIERYAATLDPVYAAEKAGHPYPIQAAHRHLQNEAVTGEVRRLHQRVLTEKLVPMAMARHEAGLADPNVTGQPLNRLIELAYKYGLTPSEEEMQQGLHEATPEQLTRMNLVLQARLVELSDQARPINDPADSGAIAHTAPNVLD